MVRQGSALSYQLGICVVSAGDICLVSTADICPVSAEDICPVSTTHCLCVRNRHGSDTWKSDGSRQPYSNFSNRPHPPRQNRGAVLMGSVLWRVTENPNIALLGFGQILTFQKKGYDLDIRPSGGNSGWHGWMRRQKLV